MRYDKLVKFHTVTNSEYDPVTGEYPDDTEEVTELVANVTDLGTARSIELFGDLHIRRKVVRFTVEPLTVWDYLTIDGEANTYVLETRMNTSKGNAIIVKEDIR